MLSDKQHIEKFKERFVELVKTNGTSIKICAKEIGISYTTFKRIFSTDKFPRIYTIFKIARYYKVSMDYLLGISDDKNVR